jgi:hypothetical protein
MPEAFEPNFRLLAKIKFDNATRPQQMCAIKDSHELAIKFGMPQRHKELQAIKDLQKLASKGNFNDFKLQLQSHKKLRSGTSMQQAFEMDFPNFLGSCKNQIRQCYNATRNCVLLKIHKSWKQVKLQCYKLLNCIFLTLQLLSKIKFGKWNFNATSIQTGISLVLVPCKKQVCQCQNVKKNCALLKICKRSESSMPQVFETDLTDFSGSCKHKIYQCHNAARNCPLLKIRKSWQASETLMPQAFEMDFLIFGDLKKINLAKLQRHKESRAIKDLQELASKWNFNANNQIFLTFGSLQKSNLSMPQDRNELHAIEDSHDLASKFGMPQRHKELHAIKD